MVAEQPNKAFVRQGLSHGEYNVGWICALHNEMAASMAMLDSTHADLPRTTNDGNSYALGNIGQHNIAITCLPESGYGTNNAATVASNMRRTFPCITICLMVGIGGGVPGKVDIRLGDVVVSTQIVQYDLGKALPTGFQRTVAPHGPPHEIMTAVAKLRAIHEAGPSKISSILADILERNPSMAEYAGCDSLKDLLFDSDYDHAESMGTCDRCDMSKLLERPNRYDRTPRIHYGTIASGNHVMRHGRTRDQIARELGAICFEMEAAGLIVNSPCLVIRGICDYSDSHKSKEWQKYAAATAAAYARELLIMMPARENFVSQSYAMRASDDKKELPPEVVRQMILSSFKFEHIDSRRSDIRVARSETCEWFLAHPDYKAWLDPVEFPDHRGFLWINGKPGAGKSTLMKFLNARAEASSSEDAVVVSFFFSARGDELEKSVVGMYRSLLLQLLTKLPDLQSVLDGQIFRTQDAPVLSVELLHRYFSDAIAKLGQRQLTCFIDALDESDEDQVRDMISRLESFGSDTTQTNTGLYICFSSRHYPYIDIQRGKQLTIEDQPGHTEGLATYLQSTLRVGSGPIAEEVRSEILGKASGVFMWAVLVVHILNEEFRRGRMFAVKKRLREVPAQLSDLFRDILKRDTNNVEDLLLGIQWILYARRPLKREEFYYAVVSGLEPDDLAEWNPDYLTPADMNRFVLSCCKGLAEVTKSSPQTVQFIHESVRDFLVKDNGLRKLWPELGEDFQSSSHDRLKQCCQTYTQIDISQGPRTNDTAAHEFSVNPGTGGEALGDRYPFLEYATDYVLFHADNAAQRLPQDAFLENFPVQSWLYWYKLVHHRELSHPDLTILYFLAENNYARLIATICNRNPTFDLEEGRHTSPLFGALSMGNQSAVSALLQKEITLPKVGAEPGQRGFLYGFFVEEGQTPLSWAAMTGHEMIVKWLLEKGAYIHTRDKEGQTPLIWAARKGHEAVARHLLDQGADTAGSCKLGQTPLTWAARIGHEGMVRLLLEKGASIEARSRLGHTPLAWAAMVGREGVVRQLLQKGADINARDGNARTPLAWATMNRHNKVRAYLVENGGSI